MSVVSFACVKFLAIRPKNMSVNVQCVPSSYINIHSGKGSTKQDVCLVNKYKS